jgi:hypothetical protein
MGPLSSLRAMLQKQKVTGRQSTWIGGMGIAVKPIEPTPDVPLRRDC